MIFTIDPRYEFIVLYSTEAQQVEKLGDIFYLPGDGEGDAGPLYTPRPPWKLMMSAIGLVQIGGIYLKGLLTGEEAWQLSVTDGDQHIFDQLHRDHQGEDPFSLALLQRSDVDAVSGAVSSRARIMGYRRIAEGAGMRLDVTFGVMTSREL